MGSQLVLEGSSKKFLELLIYRALLLGHQKVKVLVWCPIGMLLGLGYAVLDSILPVQSLDGIVNHKCPHSIYRSLK
jgi:hypothetical protein